MTFVADQLLEEAGIPSVNSPVNSTFGFDNIFVIDNDPSVVRLAILMLLLLELSSRHVIRETVPEDFRHWQIEHYAWQILSEQEAFDEDEEEDSLASDGYIRDATWLKLAEDQLSQLPEWVTKNIRYYVSDHDAVERLNMRIRRLSPTLNNEDLQQLLDPLDVIARNGP